MTVVDIGLSNTGSVLNAFQYLGAKTEVTGDPKSVLSAEVIVLPGVGSYRQAMERLRESELGDAITASAQDKGNKILGICLGMQLLGRSGTEDGITAGLDIIPADVAVFTSPEVRRRKIPHVGFNSVRPAVGSVLFEGLPQNPDFYFVHSYRMMPEGLTNTTSLCNYGTDFVAAYEHENIFATQFHPEKSQVNGLQLLKNFLEA
ncbi:MAG: imidazole glycerol phosphate synthase subunit HisH [Candidatus Nanopelagicales bacterium]|nr:imidazole glycerol phosphate synthase subunit HisH [Candidatus Nanopelagicales bacterium]